jgi:hypothetical protein
VGARQRDAHNGDAEHQREHEVHGGDCDHKGEPEDRAGEVAAATRLLKVLSEGKRSDVIGKGRAMSGERGLTGSSRQRCATGCADLP